MDYMITYHKDYTKVYFPATNHTIKLTKGSEPTHGQLKSIAQQLIKSVAKG